MPNQPFDRSGVDPSVTDEEIERALDTTEPADFPDADDVQDDLDDDSEPRGLVGVGVVAASKPQRIANARKLRVDQTFVGVNRCLAVVRGPILGLPAVEPTAAIAGDHSSPFHPIADADSTAVPRAAIGFAWNGGAGHVWLELGAVKVGGKPLGLVSTTDFHESGFEGVALRSRMLTWCRATRWGWGESVNGFDVWPDLKKPVPPPWTWEDRLAQLHRDLKRARDHGASKRHIAGLKAWIDKLEERHK
jgi:hypothetical protein